MRRKRIQRKVSQLLVFMLLAELLAMFSGPVRPGVGYAASVEQEGPGTDFDSIPIGVTDAVYSWNGAAPPMRYTTGDAAAGSIHDYKWEKITGQTFVPEARHSAAMAYDEAAGKVVLFGGANGTELLLDDTWLWDGVEQEWQEVNLSGVKPPKRKGAAIAYDPGSGRVLLFGGQGQSGALNDTWLWDGVSQTWEEVPISGGPLPRSYAQMAHYYIDEGQGLQGRAVLFGGIDGAAIHGDTWVWDGAARAWTQQAPGLSPPPLHTATMAFDGANAVLFGGNAGPVVNEPVVGHPSTPTSVSYEKDNNRLWLWDGATWTAVRGPEQYRRLIYDPAIGNNLGAEPYDYGRWAHVMAYDGRRVVYYGGETEWVNYNSYFGWQTVRTMRPENGRIDYFQNHVDAVFSWRAGDWETVAPGHSSSNPPWQGFGHPFETIAESDTGPFELPTYNYPLPRNYASMAFDGTNFVMFGGKRTEFELKNSSYAVVLAAPYEAVNETWTFGFTPPEPPKIQIHEPIIALLDKHTHQDRVSVVTDVYGDGSRPILSRGLEYRKAGEAGQEEPEWTAVAAEGADAGKTGSVTVHLDNALEWQVEYEIRAYARNELGTGYSQVVRFKLTEDEDMEDYDVSFIRVGPAFLHSKDKKRIVAVGDGMLNLLRRPGDEVNYLLQGQGGEESPLAYRIRSNTELELTWQADLPDGVYDLVLDHDFYTSDLFEGAVTITSQDFYKPRNYAKIEVASESPQNLASKLTLQGLFVETPEAPGLYVLADPQEEIVAINDSVMFQGASLEVDKRTHPHTIRGNGRLYVNSGGTTGMALSYTLFEGSFEIRADHFGLSVPDPETTDYLGMGFPITAASIVLTDAGVQLGGTIDLSFEAGDQKVDGRVSTDRLEFNGGGFRMSGSFPVSYPFSAGSFRVPETIWHLDSRHGYASATATAQLPEYDLDFNMLLNFKMGRLDGIAYMLSPGGGEVGATGTRFNYLFGEADDLARYSQLPQTYRFEGAVSDVFAMEMNDRSMMSAYELNTGLPPSGYASGGGMRLYWYPVTELEMQVDVDPLTAGKTGRKSAGFTVDGRMNAFDVFAGPLTLAYTKQQGLLGQMTATVTVPNQIPLAGRKATNVPVTMDAEGMYASFKVNDVGVKIDYLFRNNEFQIGVIAPPPPKPWWMKTMEILDTINTYTEPFTFNSRQGLASLSDRGDDGWRSRAAEVRMLSAGFGSAGRLAAAGLEIESDEAVQMTFARKAAAESVHPGGDEAAAVAARVGYGQFTAVERHLATDVSWLSSDASGHRVAYAFETKRPLEAMLMLEGDRRNVRLTGPSGQSIVPGADNAVVLDGVTYFRVSLDRAGAWRLSSPDAVRFTLHELMHVRADLGIAALAGAMAQSPDRDVTLIPMAQSGRMLLTVGSTLDDAVIYKADGRPYSLEENEHDAGWNAYRDSSSGLLFVLADAAEPGDWLVDGGGSADVNQYAVKPDTTMSEVREWAQSGRYPTAIQLGKTVNNQVLLEIYGADEQTSVLKPDGSAYALRTDHSKADWNAYYDSDLDRLTVLVHGATAGEWTVSGSRFANVKAYTISVPLGNLQPLYWKGIRKQTVQLDIPEPGQYLLAVAGGHESVKITPPGAGQPMPLIFDPADPRGNAILQRWQDRQAANPGELDNASVKSAIPDPGAKDMLYVTLNAEQAGTWRIEANGKVELTLTRLPALPELVDVAASAAGGTNRFDVRWNVRNAGPDTQVAVMVTDDRNRPIGEVVADNLPAAGVRTIDIPSGFMPGTYYLSVMARGTGMAPLTQVISEPVSLTTAQSLPKPQTPQLLSTGNGEVTLQLQPLADPAVDYYRIFVLKDGVPDYRQPAFDMDAAWTQIALSGLETDRSYQFAAMAVGVKNGETVISPLSGSLEAYLPVPQRPALEAELTAVQPAASAIVERTIKDAYGEDRTLLATSAEGASLRVVSSQAGQLALSVNGEELERRSVTAGASADFDLNALLGAATLKERIYDLRIEAVNSAGDRGSLYRKLYIDRTGPYLYAASRDNPEIGLNGLVVSGKRVPIVGQTDAGSKLTVDGLRVPLDESGRFVFFAPWSDDRAVDGKLDMEMIAEDEVGNRTISRFQVLQNSGTITERHPAELAALTLGSGRLDFHPDLLQYFTQQEETVKVYAVPADPDAAVTVNGLTPDGEGSVELSVPSSGLTLTIEVTGAGDQQRTYTVNVSRIASDVALLDGLELSAGGEAVPLSPGFAGVLGTYSASVSYATNEVMLKPTARADGSTIIVNGETVASGTAVAVPLAAGAETPVSIAVTAPNGQAAKTYSLHVWREGSGDAKLQQLSVGSNQLLPQFDGSVTNYRVLVPAAADQVQIDALPAGEGASVAIDGAVTQSAAVPLTGNVKQTIEISVTAANGAEQVYRLAVQRQGLRTAAVAPPRLTELALGSLKLEEDFSPYRMSYRAAPTSAAAVALTARADDPAAVITVNGERLAEDGKANVRLQTGDNLIVVRAESADGRASHTYSVAVVRKSGSAGNGGSAQPEGRKATVQTDGGEASVTIVRSRAMDGSMIDTISIDAVGARDIVGLTRGDTSAYARVILSERDDPADQYELSILREALGILAEANIRLILAIGDAEIELSQHTLRSLDEAGRDLYFRVVPVLDADMRKQVNERLLADNNVKEAAGGRQVKLIGAPMKIETNYSGYRTRVVLPLPPAEVPASRDKAEADRLREELAVYIEHSDGSRELARGTLRSNADGRPDGIEIEVDRFSTFAVIRLPDGEETGPKRHEPYLLGYPDGTFRPSQQVTRAEIAAMLDRALGAQPAAAERLPYVDVRPNYWAYEAIGRMREQGLMQGDANGQFRPEAAITRAEMATIAMRWRGLQPQAKGPSRFADTAGHWAEPMIARMENEGILRGYPDGTFRPNQPLVRAEAVRIINAILNRPVPSGSGDPVWPDVPASYWARQDIESASGRIVQLPDGSMQLQRE
ncbi:cadherin-like beta sandwich domain-containing protein [Paenibacillaceae bacterium WGS1546]|uniref:cadherin-like beta sandwich domain-containing protein n=1 Tax=Cohnella sp. WGS1546 TaxID=3366810 RepID=UPI00372CF7B7